MPSMASALRKQPAAEAEILLGEDHPGAGAPCGQRRHEAGRASADHEHVAMGEGLLVVVWVRLQSRRGRARRSFGSIGS